MKRLLSLLVLPLLLVLAGCSSLLGTGDWDLVKVTYAPGSEESAPGYALVVTPEQASYTLDGKESVHELPAGTWDLLATGVRALGDHASPECLDGAHLTIEASAAGSVKQTFEATTCDAGDLLANAQGLIQQVINQLK